MLAIRVSYHYPIYRAREGETNPLLRPQGQAYAYPILRGSASRGRQAISFEEEDAGVFRHAVEFIYKGDYFPRWAQPLQEPLSLEALLRVKRATADRGLRPESFLWYVI
jgi:hypothetical protein